MSKWKLSSRQAKKARKRAVIQARKERTAANAGVAR